MGAGGVAERGRLKPGERPRGELGHGRTVGTVIESEELGRALFREGCVPRRESAVDRVGPALGRGREGTPLGAEDVQVELGQRALRQVGEAERQLAGLRDRARPSPRA